MIRVENDRRDAEIRTLSFDERMGWRQGASALAACPVPGSPRVKAIHKAGSGNLLLLLPSPIPLSFSFCPSLRTK